MSEVMVTRRGGTTVAMTMRSALAIIPREVDLNPILRRMGLLEEVVVPTTDGGSATMAMRIAKGPDPDQTPFDGPYTKQADTWPVTALAAPRPFHLYHGKLRVLLELQLGFSVAAASEEHATEIVSEVTHGHPAPDTFKLNYDMESIQDFLRDLHDLTETGSLKAIADRISSHEVLGYEDYLDYQDIQPELLYQEKP